MAERFTIKAIGAKGEGAAQSSAGPLFVPFTAVGDEIEAEIREQPGGGRMAADVRVIKPGPGRAEPACRHYEDCGGCSLQHLGEEVYSEWITGRIGHALRQHGFENVDIRPPAVSPPATRRRLTLTVDAVADGVAMGFNRSKSHDIVDIAECPVALPSLADRFPPLRQALQPLIGAIGRCRIAITATSGGIDCVLEGRRDLAPGIITELAEFAVAAGLAAFHARIDGIEDPLAVAGQPYMDFSGVPVPFPPAAFVQATGEGEAALVAAVMEAVAGARRVADLFAGLGTFSCAMAREASVDAVEGAARLVGALDDGLRRAQGLKPVAVHHRDIYRQPLEGGELSPYDAVVFDPPRAGAPAQSKALARSGVPVAVAVSCNPNTFARDARLLADGGYGLDWVQPVGQFLWSHHVELVARFSR